MIATSSWFYDLMRISPRNDNLFFSAFSASLRDVEGRHRGRLLLTLHALLFMLCGSVVHSMLPFFHHTINQLQHLQAFLPRSRRKLLVITGKDNPIRNLFSDDKG